MIHSDYGQEPLVQIRKRSNLRRCVEDKRFQNSDSKEFRFNGTVTEPVFCRCRFVLVNSLSNCSLLSLVLNNSRLYGCYNSYMVSSSGSHSSYKVFATNSKILFQHNCEWYIAESSV